MTTSYQLELTSREPIEVNDRATQLMYSDIKKIAGGGAGSTYEAIRKLKENPGYNKLSEKVKWQLLFRDVPVKTIRLYLDKGYTVDQVYAGLPPSMYREKQDVSPVTQPGIQPLVMPKVKTQPVTPVLPQSEPEPVVEPSQFNWLAELRPMVQDTTFPYGYYGNGVINTQDGTKTVTNYPTNYLTYAK